MGMFGIAEIIANLEQTRARASVFAAKVGSLMPTREDLQARMAARSCAAPRSARCSASCPAAARCSRRSRAYTLEKKVSKRPGAVRQGRDRGRGRRRKSANNAGAQTSFIPLLTLGIPANAVMALMIGAHDDPGHRARARR